MKKFLCLILALSSIFVFTLFGCTNDKSKPISQNALIDYSNDMQITYLCSGGGSSIPATKSDTGYYYIGDDRIIIYIDSKTQKATPLCAKPDCMHNDPDTCDAYVNSSENISQDSLWGSLGTAIQYYQGYLYMVCGEYDKSMIEYNTYLMKMDKDGTNRQKVTDYFDSPFTNWFIHQGYFYYTSDSSVLRIPLTNPKSSPEEVYKAQHFIKDNENTYSSFCAYKNYIYFQVDELDEEGNGIGRQTICLNLDTMKKSFLKIGKNNASFSAFAGDSMIMYYSDGNEKVYVKADLEGNNCKNIFSQKSNTSIFQNCIYFNTILFFSAFIFVATLQIPENFPENFQRDNRIVTYFSVENKNLERIILHTISSLSLFMSILNFIHLKS